MAHSHPSSPAEAACCATEQDAQTAHAHDHSGHDHAHDSEKRWRTFLPALLSGGLLGLALMLESGLLPKPTFYTDTIRRLLYGAAYMPVGLPVLRAMVHGFRKGEVFSEFTLMVLATVGAFYLGEYPEAVAVMLFYAVGEAFQGMAVRRAKSNIKLLLDQRPDTVNVWRAGVWTQAQAKQVTVGERVQLHAGDKVALDGILVSNLASFNAAALTGESIPVTKHAGEPVLAGMINGLTVAEMEVKTPYTDSKLSRILALVQHASTQKAPTELFIRKFARYYTPAVVVLAAAIVLLPYFWAKPYLFNDWLYRALVFLVISCPCALVVSIPLGYFGGIGAASRHGILVKGGQFLDMMAKIRHLVLDKTGTLTKGIFEVQQVVISPPHQAKGVLAWVNALEQQSTHPVASAIRRHIGAVDTRIAFDRIEELPGHGLRAWRNGRSVLVGNTKLLDKYGIAYPNTLHQLTETVIAFVENEQFLGYLTIADELKPDAAVAVERLHQMGIHTTLLSGDKTHVVQAVAHQLNIPNAYGDLLPEDKVEKVRFLKNQSKPIAFVGDGVNDAPVVALSDVGIAMGGLGSDATLEAADIVIQDDRPSKIPLAITIGQQTKRIVWQNVALAFGVKLLVLALGAGGLATMWEAVFADVGVALLAILNAVRIQRVTFR